MNFKDIFKYTPPTNYNFIIKPTNSIQPPEDSTSKKIYSNINKNLDYIKSVYNTLINSDIVLREFDLMAGNNKYKAFLLYIDGMADSDLINEFILKALMPRNNNSIYVSEKNKKQPNLITKKSKEFDLNNYIYTNLMPQKSVKYETNFSNIIEGVNSGNCALFVDSISSAFDIDVKKYNSRGVDKPENEVIIKGPQESFIENIRTNTSLLRKIVNNENLVIENIPVGNISKTKCGVCYMKNIANSDLVGEVKFRLSNLSIDSLLSTGQLEQLLDEEETFGIPQLISTERPDKCCKYLFQGRIIILVNGNPYALIAPATIEDFLFSPEDTNLKPIFTNFLRAIRLIAGIITLLLPGLYIAVTSFHQEILPTELLFSILSARENVPFPMIFELLLMEFSFELIREAGLRVPSPIGSTIGIVGALILGDAAVNAGIVSPILIIVVAITGISSFAIPDFSFGFHLRVFRFIFIALGFTAGFLGIGIGLFIYLTLLCSLKSFGVPYTSPITPSYSDNNGYFIPPIWKQEFRDSFLSPKRKKSQAKISMKWKY